MNKNENKLCKNFSLKNEKYIKKTIKQESRFFFNKRSLSTEIMQELDEVSLLEDCDQNGIVF